MAAVVGDKFNWSVTQCTHQARLSLTRFSSRESRRERGVVACQRATTPTSRRAASPHSTGPGRPGHGLRRPAASHAGHCAHCPVPTAPLTPSQPLLGACSPRPRAGRAAGARRGQSPAAQPPAPCGPSSSSRGLETFARRPPPAGELLARLGDARSSEYSLPSPSSLFPRPKPKQTNERTFFLLRFRFELSRRRNMQPTVLCNANRHHHIDFLKGGRQRWFQP